MVEIFRLSQNRDLRKVVDVSVSEVIFKRHTFKNSVAIIDRQSLDENDAYP